MKIVHSEWELRTIASKNKFAMAFDIFFFTQKAGGPPFGAAPFEK